MIPIVIDHVTVNHVTALPVLPLLNDSSLLVCSSQPFQLV